MSKKILSILVIFILCVGFSANAQDPTEVEFSKTVGENIDELRILRSDDKTQLNRIVTKTFELEHAVAFELYPHILKTVKPEGGTVRGMKYKNPNGETDYFLQVICPEFQLEGIEQTIKMLDREGVVSSEGDLKYHARTYNRPASEIAEILDNTVLSGEGSVSFDDKTNTVYLKDSVSDGERDIETIKFYDTAPPQAEISIWILETEDGDFSDLGLDWNAWKKSISGDITITGSRDLYKGRSGVVDHAVADAVLNIDANALVEFINYLASNNRAEIIEHATLTVINNRRASVRNVSVIERASNPTTVEIEDDTEGIDEDLFEGIVVDIMPSIFINSMDLDISVSVNSFVGYNKYGSPLISERDTETTVNISEDQTIKLGSLKKTTVVEKRDGIPILKEIPVLRWFVSRQVSKEQDSNIIVFVSPVVKSRELYGSTAMKSKDILNPPVAIENTNTGLTRDDMLIFEDVK